MVVGLVFALAFAFVHAQTVVNVTSLSQLSSNSNSEFRLLSTLVVRTSVTINNSVIICSFLPCFAVDIDANANDARVTVTVANVTFRFTPPATASQVFTVNNVGHLLLSNLTFRTDESERISLVQWSSSSRGNLTIRGLGSAARPIGFQSVLVALSTSQIDAFVFEDAHGSCASGQTCITLYASASSAAVPISTIAFGNVHWRQNGTATELVRLVGSFASLSVTRGTTFDQLRVEGATVRNITIKSCTMYGGIRARGMSAMHISDVRFLLEDFFKKSDIPHVIDTTNSVAASFVVENVVATSNLELGLHLLGLFNDTSSTVVFRNVTVVGLRGMFLCQASSGSLSQLFVENVQTRGCKFVTNVLAPGVRKTAIANVSVIDNVGEANDVQYLLRTAAFDEIRASNIDVVGGRFVSAVLFEGGSANSILSLRDVQISNATMVHGVFVRPALDALPQSFAITTFRVQHCAVEQSVVFANASTSLAGLTLLNVTILAGAAVSGDFPVIDRVTVRGSVFGDSEGLVDSKIAVPRNVSWTRFDVQGTAFQSYLAVVRCPQSVRVNVTLSEWSIRDVVAMAAPFMLLVVQNSVDEAVVDRFFVSPFQGSLWNNVGSQKFTLRNSAFDRTDRLIWEHPSAANVVVVQNVTMTAGNCTPGQPALGFADASSVSVSALRVSGGTCMALEVERCNATVLDSLFERINATSAVQVANSTATITDCIFRSMGVGGSVFLSSRSTVLLQNVLFEDNFSPRASAIRSVTGKLQIVGSRFFNNSAQTEGGAIVANTLSVTRSVFRGNSAGDNGAAILGDNLLISECDFEKNVGRSVIFVRNPTLPVVIATSSFFGNTIRSANDTGGVVLLANGTFEVRVEQSCLCNNTRASFDCDALAVSLAVDNTTETEGASLRCPLAQFQASNCRVAGCERRILETEITSTATKTMTPMMTRTMTTTTTTTTTTPTTTTTTTPTMTTTPPTTTPINSGALGAIIGGCVGGVLILVGVIAFIVVRKRTASASPAATTPSEYGSAIPLSSVGADYDRGGIPVMPPTENASANYGSAGLAQADYGDGRLDVN
jgi:hypothetical protein